MVNPVVVDLIAKFKKKLCDSESCPSDSSLRQYAYSIAWLKKRVDFPEDGMPKPEHVMEYLENSKVTNRKRCSVYTALKKWHGSHGEKCDCDKYSKPLVRAKHAVDAEYAKQERTPKQQTNGWTIRCSRSLQRSYKKRSRRGTSTSSGRRSSSKLSWLSS